MAESTKAGCTTIGCPRDADIDLPVRMPKSEMLKDTSGNYWCQLCSKRYELMNWAKDRNFPATRVQSLTHDGHYAITGDVHSWFTGVAMGNQDMIDALYAAFIDNE